MYTPTINKQLQEEGKIDLLNEYEDYLQYLSFSQDLEICYKNNDCHLAPPAGIVSLIIMSLALTHNMIPATISVNNPHLNISLKLK